MNRTGFIARSRAGLVGAIIALTLAGCASTGPTALQLNQAQEARAAIQRAEEAGAREHAPILLRDAEEKITEAQRVYRRRGGATSQRLLEAARVDAELAEQTARAARARATAREVEASIQALREEMARQRNN
jgi:uncharacterized lipoprotein YmbA